MPSEFERGAKSELSAEYQKDLMRHHDSLTLLETEESWDTIAKALKALSILIDNDGRNFPFVLTPFLREHARPISKAAASERSRLSGAAIELLCSAARALGKAFEPILPMFLPALLAVCARPNKVFITRAKACIETIIQETTLPSILPYLAEALKDKSTSVRMTAIEGVYVCLNCFNPPDLEKEVRAHDVERAIFVSATDANADVRKLCRKVWDAYKILLPQRVDQFAATMSPTTRKYLNVAAAPPPAPSRPTSSSSTHSLNAPYERPATALATVHADRGRQEQRPNHGRTRSASTVLVKDATSARVALSARKDAPAAVANKAPETLHSRQGPMRPLSRVDTSPEGRATVTVPPLRVLPSQRPQPLDKAIRGDLPRTMSMTVGPLRPLKKTAPTSDSTQLGPSRDKPTGGARRILLPPPEMKESSSSQQPQNSTKGDVKIPAPVKSSVSSKSSVSLKSSSSSKAVVASKPHNQSKPLIPSKPTVSSKPSASSKSPASVKNFIHPGSKPTVPRSQTAHFDRVVAAKTATVRRKGLTEPTLSQLSRVKATKSEKKTSTAPPAKKAQVNFRSKPSQEASKKAAPRNNKGQEPVVESNTPGPAQETAPTPEPQIDPAQVPLPRSPSPPIAPVEALEDGEAVPAPSGEADPAASTIPPIRVEVEDVPPPSPGLAYTTNVHAAQTPMRKFLLNDMEEAKTPISALLSSIHRGFIFTPGSLSPSDERTFIAHSDSSEDEGIASRS